MSYLRPTACLLATLLPIMMAQAEPPAPQDGVQAIALELDGCMAEGNWLPEPTLACARHAESRWQKEIDRLTIRLDKVLGRDARLTLDASKVAWQESREADMALVEAYHAQLADAELGDPELLGLSRQLHRNGVLERRARFLERLLDGLEEHRQEPTREPR